MRVSCPASRDYALLCRGWCVPWRILTQKEVLDLRVDTMQPLLSPLCSPAVGVKFCLKFHDPVFGRAQLLRKLLRHAKRARLLFSSVTPAAFWAILIGMWRWWLVIQHVARAAGSDAALLVQIMFYHRVFAPLRDPIIDQLETRPSDHVAAPR